ncbi:MAG: OmpA family protein, partial [Bacteroidales bacterium]|nr:OmpA family protein [Bacteroidales bacterium]
AKSTYNEAQWRWIADRYEEGYPLSVIASTLYMAKSTVEYLVQHGVDRGRFEIKGYGLTMPCATNDTEEGRQMNRRIEAKIIE